MAESFQPGEVVHLKSGGPSMTVEFEEHGEFQCTWFDGAKRLQDKFLLVLLECGPALEAKRPTITRPS
jgi:uncharacterized protein YodC (DUF2158 family)